jgi:heme-degrading monooxygenase HmoA
VVAGREAEFEKFYDSGGEWQELLKKQEGFLRTELRYESVAEARYSSFDHWRSHTDFEVFRETFQVDVKRFEDEIAERKLIESEVLLGSYYVDESGDDEGLVQA